MDPVVNTGIFKTPGRAWVAVTVYTALLYSTLTVAFRIYVYFFDRLGKPFMSRFMAGIYIPVGLALLVFMFMRLPRRWGGYVAFLLIGLTLAFCLRIIEIPAKRFHFLEYSPLTVLVFDALRFRVRDRFLYVWTFLVVALLGLGDEIIQGILPNRYFGLSEVVTNAAAGLLTLAFIGFVMGEENYPWGIRRRARGAGEPSRDAAR
jgi:VanZ family protein